MHDFVQLEKYFHTPHPHSHELLEGEGVVVVSAPHSVEQLRNGRIKQSEPQTGVIARLLHEEIGCPVIYKTAYRDDDANHDDNSPYRDELTRYCEERGIKLVLDLHQLSQSRPMDMDVGTGRGKHIANKRYLDILLDNLTSHSLGYVLDIPFSASKPYTVSGHVYNHLGITTIQLEINSRLVWGLTPPDTYEAVYQAIKNTVITINQEDRL